MWVLFDLWSGSILGHATVFHGLDAAYGNRSEIIETRQGVISDLTLFSREQNEQKFKSRRSIRILCKTKRREILHSSAFKTLPKQSPSVLSSTEKPGNFFHQLTRVTIDTSSVRAN